jgi:hypothetical protein
MIVKVRYEPTCKITNEKTGQSIDAEVVSFNQTRNLTVVVNRSIKVLLNWNGRVYEGRAAGMDFISDGPKGQKYTEGR